MATLTMTISHHAWDRDRQVNAQEDIPQDATTTDTGGQYGTDPDPKQTQVANAKQRVGYHENRDAREMQY